ncbi:hypothetical protein [Legionella hackeliae]|uniref:Transmembrane protein n=1 Tax=Legionella hackeliae TaxID=449 RepID=A0A0A8UXB2_LEGHA|nr:hypothetical protein [Legionella hackeliae]KTD12712.1 transmembrane protein [Legionella hackeliae]CEK12131.1 conserved membrane protein of unknown function [Legionella hackeliae]STX48917.1 transmembrane protein [Legionella hackeliae]
MTNELTPTDSIELTEQGYVYHIAGRMDTQTRLMAKQLHELGIVYAIYGALDGLSLSYSMIKYLFDLLYGNGKISTSDIMHDWMLTPEGIAVAASSTITLVVFAMLANHFKDDDKNQFKAFVATAWPYCRDTMKGLKNAYKGFRSAVQVIDLLGGQNLNFMIVPMGLLLGVLSAANRIWFRYQVNIRKDMMKANAKLLTEIKNMEKLSLPEIAIKRAEIQSQSMALRRQMLLSAAYGGVVDGLYLYVGVLSLCSLTPPLFLAMSVFCAIYFVACIATRVYEEHDFQRRLVITQAKIELALCGKELETQFNALVKLAEEIATKVTDEKLTDQRKLVDEISHLREDFEKRRAYLRELSTLSYSSAFLAGIKNGLAAYGALASSMFAVATVIVLASSSFPPALLVACISAGMALLVAFVAHALINAYRHQVKQDKITIDNPHDEKLNTILESLKGAKQHVEDLKPEKVRTAITDGMVVDPSPQFFFQEWFEVVRSFFSGLGKGSKAVDFTMNSFQERGTDGHYHDTPIMLGLTVVSALVHGTALALRAQARGFGRDPIDNVPSVVKASETSGVTTTSLEGESDRSCELVSDSPKANASLASDKPRMINGGDTDEIKPTLTSENPRITAPESKNRNPQPFYASFFRADRKSQSHLPRSQSSKELQALVPGGNSTRDAQHTPTPTIPTQYW